MRKADLFRDAPQRASCQPKPDDVVVAYHAKGIELPTPAVRIDRARARPPHATTHQTGNIRIAHRRSPTGSAIGRAQNSFSGSSSRIMRLHVGAVIHRRQARLDRVAYGDQC